MEEQDWAALLKEFEKKGIKEAKPYIGARPEWERPWLEKAAGYPGGPQGVLPQVRRPAAGASTFGIQVLDEILYPHVEKDWYEKLLVGGNPDAGADDGGLPMQQIYEGMQKDSLDYFRDSMDENIRNVMTAHEGMTAYLKWNLENKKKEQEEQKFEMMKDNLKNAGGAKRGGVQGFEGAHRGKHGASQKHD